MKVGKSCGKLRVMLPSDTDWIQMSSAAPGTALLVCSWTMQTRVIVHMFFHMHASADCAAGLALQRLAHFAHCLSNVCQA